ncbi:MAG: hypothetical protein RIR70_543 [Pseudomonadota bacterium]|jgi:cytochrome c553
MKSPFKPLQCAPARALFGVVFGLALCAASPAPAAEPVITPDAARSLAATCANCHGTNGKAVSGAGMAPLAGMDRAHLLRALTEFRNSSRPATVMHQISKGYTEAQLDAIASWFAAQK